MKKILILAILLSVSVTGSLASTTYKKSCTKPLTKNYSNESFLASPHNNISKTKCKSVKHEAEKLDLAKKKPKHSKTFVNTSVGSVLLFLLLVMA